MLNDIFSIWSIRIPIKLPMPKVLSCACLSDKPGWQGSENGCCMYLLVVFLSQTAEQGGHKKKLQCVIHFCSKTSANTLSQVWQE